jgi:hypothetical protein
MNNKNNAKTIVVAGDVTIDWNIARVQRADVIMHVWNAEDLTTSFCQRGGVVMLTDLTKSIARNLNQTKQADITVRQISIPRGPINPCNNNFHHSYAIWSPFKIDESKSEEGEKVWRVQEFLGLSKASTDKSLSDNWKKVADDPINPDLIILDDAALGFRDSPEYWPQSLSKSNSKPWVLLKMAKPVAQGRLWNHLLQNHADRLIVVMTVDDLRRSQVHISRQVSWERTAQDLMWELLYNPHVNEITQCAHAIISFNTAGAILLSKKPGSSPDAFLFFDPAAMEGQWGNNHKGYMIGYNSCLAGGIARELMSGTKDLDIFRGVQSGICAMRALHIMGYGRASIEPKKINLAFPATEVAAKLAQDCGFLSVVPIRNPALALSGTATAESAHFWTVLEDKSPGSLERIARIIVREGLEHALPEVPIGKFGKLKTIDRKEIEALYNISNLINEYCESHQKTPLSIAVFGPPGSGKSFAVKQVASSMRKGEIEEINFNLSQLGGPEDLLGAYHQIRDKALSGMIPLVFWDEFDTCLQNQTLGWLRYFLAPMQDGQFQEGQITHHIGRCIFVFAGGTSYTMEAFGANLRETKKAAAKLPDFVSRLRGFLNILGPNSQESKDTNVQTKDSHYIIRRAIILRSIFDRLAPQLIHGYKGKRVTSIDEGVLRAFLLTREYRHGARSMEAIVAISQLSGKTSFEPSSVPSEAQLNLHVDGHDFYTLMHLMELDKEFGNGFDKNLLEKLAEAAHEVFCDDLRAKRYKYGPLTLEDKKEHNSLKPYAELPENEKESNRNNVKDIPNKLAIVGYAMVATRGSEASNKFQNDEVEKLAIIEHERWMKEKLDAGWQYAKMTDKAKKLNKFLISWDKLPEDEKEKDRVLVKGIPIILAKAGYIMVKIV